MMEMRNVKRAPSQYASQSVNQSVRQSVRHTLCGPRGKRTGSEVTTMVNMRYAVGQTANDKRKFDSGPLIQTLFVLALNKIIYMHIMYFFSHK